MTVKVDTLSKMYIEVLFIHANMLVLKPVQPMNLMSIFTSVQMAGCFLTSQFDLKCLVKAFGVLAKNWFQVFWFPDKAE